MINWPYNAQKYTKFNNTLLRLRIWFDVGPNHSSSIIIAILQLISNKPNQIQTILDTIL